MTIVIMKNLLDLCTGGIIYATIGWSLAFGAGGSFYGLAGYGSYFPLGVTDYSYFQLGIIDFAGCGPIHLLGGVLGFWSTLFLGP